MNLTRRARRASALLVATAAAAVVLAGCGGAGWPTAAGASWQEAAPPTTTTAPSTPETTAPTSPAAGSGGGADPGTPSAPSRCTTAELAGSLGPADGAAGSVNQTLVLTNTGSRTCTLRGFPGVSYVRGDGGTQAGPSAVMVGARGGDVRLGPGGSAGAAMQLANVQNFDAASCRPVAVRGLRVYPPGDTASLFVPRPGTGCSQAPTGGNQLTVQTLRAR